MKFNKNGKLDEALNLCQHIEGLHMDNVGVDSGNTARNVLIVSEVC